MPRKGYKSVTIKDETYEKLALMAEEEGKSVSQIVRELAERNLPLEVEVPVE